MQSFQRFWKQLAPRLAHRKLYYEKICKELSTQVTFRKPLTWVLVCLTEEDLGMLLSSVVISAHMWGWEGGKWGQWGLSKWGQWGLSKGTKNGAVDWALGQHGGLLNISTARYFYKVSKTILHQPTANSPINIFYNKCSSKHYLQILQYILFFKTNSLSEKRTFLWKIALFTKSWL